MEMDVDMKKKYVWKYIFFFDGVLVNSRTLTICTLR